MIDNLYFANGEQPRYEHGCKHCLFMGQHGENDAWLCLHRLKDNWWRTNIILRRGIEGDYRSAEFLTLVTTTPWSGEGEKTLPVFPGKGYVYNTDEPFVPYPFDHPLIVAGAMDIISRLHHTESLRNKFPHLTTVSNGRL